MISGYAWALIEYIYKHITILYTLYQCKVFKMINNENIFQFNYIHSQIIKVDFLILQILCNLKKF